LGRPEGLRYSALSAIIGSTVVARQAGPRHASVPIARTPRRRSRRSPDRSAWSRRG